MTYFDSRMAALGITPENNTINLLRYNATTQKNELKPEPIFRQHDKGIEIIVYTIDREQPTYTGDTSRFKKNWSIIRYEKPIVKPDGSTFKYLMPKGQGSYPFIPPALVDKYDSKAFIQTLFITEGFFKAFKGSIHGIDVIGVASITHLKNKETGALHPDIIKLIHTCSVKRIVWLTDGDCLDISTKALAANPTSGGRAADDVDLYKRPASFYSSIATFKQLTDDLDCDKYFMHVDTDTIINEQSAISQNASRLTRDQVKGLDDILSAFPNKIQEIVQDINTVSKSGFWFQRFNITIGLSKVRDYFRLQNVNAFILFHQERQKELKGKEFIYHGTRYKYNDEKGECEVIVPGDANLYFRVGNDYYKWIELPNQYKQLERVFHDRSKATITDDHGKLFIKHIPKFEAFCNVPDHTNFQPVMHNCFNVYSPLDYEPADDECTTEDFPAIDSFVRHIFGEKEVGFTCPNTREKKTYKTYDLALDYFQLLYQQPWLKLPILCLVSRENNTGKSTLANFLRQMLSTNVAIVGNADLSGDFNAHWSTKSVVVCDETKIDKQHVIEKIKSLSTARKIWMNAKGKGQVELDCFIKFVLITNNEDNFIYAGDDDIRYWVIKVPVLKTENPDILNQFIEELPAFLSFLNKRKLATEKRNRMWFHPDLLKTDALRKVILHSQPTIQKELLHHLREMFFDFGEEQILMTLTDVRKEFFNNKYEANYLSNVLKEKLKLDMYHRLDSEQKDLFGNPLKIYSTTRYTYARWEVKTREIGKPEEKMRVDVAGTGRPYIFNRHQFLSPEEIKQISPNAETQFINQMSLLPNEDPFPT